MICYFVRISFTTFICSRLINHMYLYLVLVEEAVAEETLELSQPLPFSV